jgi:hypothetical protein
MRFQPMVFKNSASIFTQRGDSSNRDSQKFRVGNASDQHRVFSAKEKLFALQTAVSQYRPRNSGGSMIKSVAPGTKPRPQWCPTGLTHTQKRRVQRLRALKIMEKITEKKRDKWFSRDRPMVPPNMTWKAKRIIIDENRNVDDIAAAQNSKNSRDASLDGDVIKEDNPPCSCITLTEASVDLQHGEILCLTGATVKWKQRCIEDYNSGRSDTHARTHREGVHPCILKSSFAQHRDSVCVCCKLMLVFIFILCMYQVLVLATL